MPEQRMELEGLILTVNKKMPYFFNTVYLWNSLLYDFEAELSAEFKKN